MLRNKASEVPRERFKSDEIQKLIKQMKKVLYNYKLVGIAAPQIGVPYRVIVMEAPERLKEKYPAAIYQARQMEILPITVSYCTTIPRMEILLFMNLLFS